jgi:tetratricopeptide (TPR) repeat protein
MPLRSVHAPLFLTALFLLSAAGGWARPNPAASQLSFGVDMARRGLWNEALFRFQEAEKIEPDNPRIQSNLAVAYEASGKFDQALASYQKALKLAPNDKGIRTNYARFVEFYQGFKGEKTAKSGDKGLPTVRRPAVPPTRPQPTAPEPGTRPGTPEPSTQGDTPPPPADNRPPL